VAREQQRLAYRSPATALAVNMHLYWADAAADVTAQVTPRWTGCCGRPPPALFSRPLASAGLQIYLL
jgi:hypothetical protein